MPLGSALTAGVGAPERNGKDGSGAELYEQNAPVLHGALEMRAELGQRGNDLAHGLVNRAPHVLARALGLRRHRAVPAAQADRAGQLVRDEIQFVLGTCRALVIRPVARLLELRAQLLHPRPVRGLRPCVEPGADAGGVIRRERSSFGDQRIATDLCALHCGHKLENVDLTSRVLEQHGKIGEALAVPQPRLAPPIPKRPMVTLAPEPLGGRLGHDVLLPAGSIRPGSKATGDQPAAARPPGNRLDPTVADYCLLFGPFT